MPALSLNILRYENSVRGPNFGKPSGGEWRHWGANGERREKKVSPTLIGSIDDPRIIAKEEEEEDDWEVSLSNR